MDKVHFDVVFPEAADIHPNALAGRVTEMPETVMSNEEMEDV